MWQEGTDHDSPPYRLESLVSDGDLVESDSRQSGDWKQPKWTGTGLTWKSRTGKGRPVLEAPARKDRGWVLPATERGWSPQTGFWANVMQKRWSREPTFLTAAHPVIGEKDMSNRGGEPGLCAP